MDFEKLIAAWLPTVPAEITADSLWSNAAYRLSLFLSDFAWDDVTRLARDRRTRRLAEQLCSAIGSIGANYAEAYSRATDRDRCRIYGYSHGSAREARHWAYMGRHVIGPERATILISVASQIIRLLTVTIVRERERGARLSRRIQQKRNS